MAAPFSRRGDGTIRASLSEVEADTLARVAQDLASALEAPDDAMARLYPPAYPDDAVRQAAYDELTRADLETAKRAAARTTAASIEAGERRKGRWSADLDAETAEAWLSVINDARLILGTRLDVSEEMDHRPLPDGDARAPAHNLYLYLSALEEYLIDELAGSVSPD